MLWEWDGGCLSSKAVSIWCPSVIGCYIHSSSFVFCGMDTCLLFIWRVTSFPFSRLCNVACLARTGSSCGVFFPFDVILEVISSFLSPGPCLTAPSPSPSKVLAAWRIVWTCIDPMWDYSWVIGELDWAFSHQGRLTTRCLLGCHFSADSLLTLWLSPMCRSLFPFEQCILIYNLTTLWLQLPDLIIQQKHIA